MSFQKADTHVNALHRIEKVWLENEQFARLVQHACRPLQFLEIFQMFTDIFDDLK